MWSGATANLTGDAPLAPFLDRSCRRNRGCWDDTTDGLTLVSALRFESGDLSGNYRKLRITSERLSSNASLVQSDRNILERGVFGCQKAYR